MTARNSPFERKKSAILKGLSEPSGAYSDLSPKGAVDDQIRDLVDAINSYHGLVTTSSCSGRISVFVEGDKASLADNHEDALRLNGSNSEELVEERKSFASPGGKGGGGRWLYVSHEPLSVDGNADEAACLKLFGLRAGNDAKRIINPAKCGLVHFKFEPMIIHVLAASRKEAHNVLAAAHEAGFRESGAASIPADSNAAALHSGTAAASPIPVAIRTTGLAFDNIVGFATGDDEEGIETQVCDAVVSESYLRMIVDVANQKFAINAERKRRFGEMLAARMDGRSAGRSLWEDAAVRRERKKREGIQAREAMRRQQINAGDMGNVSNGEDDDGPSLASILG